MEKKIKNVSVLTSKSWKLMMKIVIKYALIFFNFFYKANCTNYQVTASYESLKTYLFLATVFGIYTSLEKRRRKKKLKKRLTLCDLVSNTF